MQSVISKFCGHYCIFYCLHRCRGVDVRRVAKMFTKDTSLNDSIVATLYVMFKDFYSIKFEKNVYQLCLLSLLDYDF